MQSFLAFCTFLSIACFASAMDQLTTDESLKKEQGQAFTSWPLNKEKFQRLFPPNSHSISEYPGDEYPDFKKFLNDVVLLGKGKGRSDRKAATLHQDGSIKIWSAPMGKWFETTIFGGNYKDKEILSLGFSSGQDGDILTIEWNSPRGRKIDRILI